MDAPRLDGYDPSFFRRHVVVLCEVTGKEDASGPSTMPRLAMVVRKTVFGAVDVGAVGNIAAPLEVVGECSVGTEVLACLGVTREGALAAPAAWRMTLLPGDRAISVQDRVAGLEEAIAAAAAFAGCFAESDPERRVSLLLSRMKVHRSAHARELLAWQLHREGLRPEARAAVADAARRVALDPSEDWRARWSMDRIAANDSVPGRLYEASEVQRGVLRQVAQAEPPKSRDAVLTRLRDLAERLDARSRARDAGAGDRAEAKSKATAVEGLLRELGDARSGGK